MLTGEVNVAIPHAYTEHINEVAITIAIPRNPVIFRNMGAPGVTRLQNAGGSDKFYQLKGRYE